MRRLKLVILFPFAMAFASACLGTVVDDSHSVELAIDSVFPTEVPSSGGVEVTVLGRNFEQETQVLVGDTPATLVTRVDDGHLSFLAPKRGYGPASLVLRSKGGQEVRLEGALRYHTETVDFDPAPLDIEGEGPPLFAGSPGSISLADLDGDGRDDVIVTGDLSSAEGVLRRIETYLNRDAGRRLVSSDSLRYTFPASSLIQYPRIADFNGDGRDDLIVGRELRLADPQGRLGIRSDLPESDPRTWPGTLGQGDFDGDGRLEFALAACPECDEWWSPSGPATLPLHILRVGPTGALEESRRVADIPTPGELLAVDLDADGVTDLVWLSTEVSDTASTLTLHARFGPDFSGPDDWSYVFTYPRTSRWGEQPYGRLYALRATGAPGPDILYSGMDRSTDQRDVVLFPNVARGFGPPQAVPPFLVAPSWGEAGVLSARYRDAGALGLSINRCEALGLCLTRWQNGQPEEWSSWSHGPLSGPMAVGELDGMEGPDVLINSPDGFVAGYGVLRSAFRPASLLSTWTVPLDDGLDGASYERNLVAGRFGTQGVCVATAGRRVQFVSGGSALNLGRGITLDESVADARACDVDADGIDDLVVSTRREGEDRLSSWDSIGSVQVVLVREEGFVVSERLRFPGPSYLRHVGQFDGDGRCDLVVAAQDGPRLYRASPAGMIWDESADASALMASGVFDIDRDGLDDFYGYEWSEDASSVLPWVLFARPDGSFERRLLGIPPGVAMLPGPVFRATRTGEVEVGFPGLDAENRKRLWTATLSSDLQLVVSGRFELTVPRPDWFYPVAGDVNGDDRLDLLVQPDSSQILLTQNGQLLPVTNPEITLWISKWLPLDLNGDLLDDLVFFTHAEPTRLGVLLNQGR